MTERLTTAVRRRLRSERGAFSAMMVLLIVMLLVVAGLVVDGGLVLNARAQTYDDVEQAARVGANQIDENALRSSGQVVLIPGQAEGEAEAFLLGLNEVREEAKYGVIDATADVTSIEVYAERQVEMSILNMVGIPPVTVRASAVAEAEVGIDAPFGP